MLSLRLLAEIVSRLPRSCIAAKSPGLEAEGDTEYRPREQFLRNTASPATCVHSLCQLLGLEGCSIPTKSLTCRLREMSNCTCI